MKRGDLARGGITASLASMLLMSSGCIHFPVQVMPRNATIPAGAVVEEDSGKEGEACKSYILYVIPVGNDSLNKAMSRVFDGSLDEPALVTVESETSTWILGMTHCTLVTAYPELATTKDDSTISGPTSPATSPLTETPTLSKSQVRRGATAVSNQVVSCFPSAATSGAPGSIVTIRFVISNDGRVASAQALGEAAGTAEGACAEMQATTATFPPFNGDKITVEFPY